MAKEKFQTVETKKNVHILVQNQMNLFKILQKN